MLCFDNIWVIWGDLGLVVKTIPYVYSAFRSEHIRVQVAMSL